MIFRRLITEIVSPGGLTLVADTSAQALLSYLKLMGRVGDISLDLIQAEL